MKKLVYELSILTDYVLPTGDYDAVTFHIENKEFLQKLIDLAYEHEYTVEIRNPKLDDTEE